jgi:hypothetical protein
VALQLTKIACNERAGSQKLCFFAPLPLVLQGLTFSLLRGKRWHEAPDDPPGAAIPSPARGEGFERCAAAGDALQSPAILASIGRIEQALLARGVTLFADLKKITLQTGDSIQVPSAGSIQKRLPTEKRGTLRSERGSSAEIQTETLPLPAGAGLS